MLFYNEVPDFEAGQLEAGENDSEMEVELRNAKFCPDESFQNRASWLSKKVAYSKKKWVIFFVQALRSYIKKNHLVNQEREIMVSLEA